MSELFRPEALRKSASRLQGELIISSPTSVRLAASAACCLAAITVAVLCSIPYTRRESVKGWLVPDAGLIRVAARQSGLISPIVQEGAFVELGATLATLRLESQLPVGAAGRLLSADMATEEAAEKEIHRATVARLESQEETLIRRLAILDSTVEQRRKQLQIAQQKAQLVLAAFERSERLVAEGFLSAAALETRRSAVLDADASISARRTDLLMATEDRAAVQQQFANVRIESQMSSQEVRRVAAQWGQRRTALAVQSSVLVVAPLSGRVLAVPVDQGQVVSATSTVAIIVPKGSTLVAELYAPTRAVGRLRPGQSVRLKYQAFPFRTHGMGRGRIQSISRTVLAPDDVKTPGLRPEEPVFRVRVALQDLGLKGTPSLQPGMLVDADIEVERHTLVGWLLGPILDRRGNAA
ncbi:HlyD family secretion protein [Phenylobacterium sp.]|jgi:membrane fusion protein|uniref:HlyD family secretion protein n=1 Tax=Phenylobacterium sp. TaxID=1871053 RepID=UPI0037C7AD27